LYDPKLNGKTLEKILTEFKPIILVVRSTKVEKQHFDSSSTLKVVIRAGAGYDTIDTKYAE